MQCALVPAGVSTSNFALPVAYQREHTCHCVSAGTLRTLPLSSTRERCLRRQSARERQTEKNLTYDCIKRAKSPPRNERGTAANRCFLLSPLIDRFAATLKRTLEIMKYLKFTNASDCTNNSVPAFPRPGAGEPIMNAQAKGPTAADLGRDSDTLSHAAQRHSRPHGARHSGEDETESTKRKLSFFATHPPRQRSGYTNPRTFKHSFVIFLYFRRHSFVALEHFITVPLDFFCTASISILLFPSLPLHSLFCFPHFAVSAEVQQNANRAFERPTMSEKARAIRKS